MTLSEYIKKLQEIESEGKGDFTVYHSDWIGSDPPEPEVNDYMREVVI